MTLMFWGRGLLITGLVGLLLGAGPALFLSQLPAAESTGFFGALAALLSLTVAPISVLIAAVGALLLLLGLLRRGRG